MTTFNLAARLLAAAPRHPDRPALVRAAPPGSAGGEPWSYGDVAAAVAAVGGGLRELGLAPGDRVLLRIGNTPLFPMVFFGAIQAGLVPVPTSTQLTAAEADWILRDSGAAVILSDGSGALPPDPGPVRILADRAVEALLAARPADAAPTSADDPAFLIYTSGTSGRPKGVLHAHRTILGRRPMLAGWSGLAADDRLLHAGAFNWTYTLGVGLMDPWSVGATAVIAAGTVAPAAWPDLIERESATIFAAVPGLYRRILKYAPLSPERLPTLRHGLTAGEALKASLHGDWVAATGRPLYEALGMSEVSTYISSGPCVPTRPGSPGRPQPGRRVAVLGDDPAARPLPAGETGRLAVHRSDPGLMLGYWGRPDETAAAFVGDWFVTGDLARFDDDGYLWYEGRADDQMNASGYRVAPEEVERVLSGHPDVAEVAAVETISGEVSLVTAVVVRHVGAAIGEADLIAFAAGELADYKRPRRIVFVDELPRTPSGKVLRRALRTL